ncbi:MAG: response regulator [Pseudohongiellaceae bacterium]
MTQHKALRLLIIDDDDEYNYLLRETVSDCEGEFTLIFKQRAEDALDYLASAGSGFPDVIFLDINMPMMDGWEFMEQYQQRNYHEKHPALIFLVSTSVYREDKARATGCSSIAEYIEKPVTDETISQIRNLFFATVENRASARRLQ